MFIVLEGIDGSGKTTILQGLTEYFLKQKLDYLIVTREPTKSPAGKKIRKGLNKKEEHSAEEFFNLYEKDRISHIKSLKKFLKKKNTIILCDRYVHSTVAYQYAQGLSKEKLLKHVKEVPAPDLTLIFDLPVDDALKRSNQRGETDLFERKEFQEKVRQNYLNLKDFFPNQKILYINANQASNIVLEETIQAISKNSKF